MESYKTADQVEGGIITDTFPVKGMSCAGCAASVESMLQSQPGVQEASVNFASQSVLLRYDPQTAKATFLKKMLQSIGFDLDITPPADPEAIALEKQHEMRKLRQRSILALALALPVVTVSMLFHHRPIWMDYLLMIVSAVVVFVLGRRFFMNAWRLARHRTANMDTLVALSTGIAFAYSAFNTLYPQYFLSRGLEPQVYYESAAVIVAFILLGRFLEERAKFRSAGAIRKLLGLQPRTLRVVRDGIEKEISLDEAIPGDLIRVRPGERIPVDGKVITGASYIDESMLTGESIPVLKESDMPVFAGTLNQKGSLDIIAEQVGKTTTLSQIIRQVQEAQGSKAPVQRLADRIAAIFVPAVLLIAGLTLAAWLIWGGTDGLTQGLTATIAVLIVACPCALGLATPTALMVGIGKGAENGILIKNAESLEKAHRMNALVLDKTGTLTVGRPEVKALIWQGENMDSVLLSLEKHSEHPLAEALVKYLEEKGTPALTVTGFESVTGKGVKGNINGQIFMAGSESWLRELGTDIPDQICKDAESLRTEANTVIMLADKEKVLGLAAMQDSLRDTTPEAIRQLRSLGVEPHLLTGDNETAARAVASQAGINQIKAQVLPSEKAAYIEKLQASGKITGMAGDGINDAQALALADVSIAMGSGTDIAMDAAQLTLMPSDLTKVAQAVRLSRATVSIIHQNLFWAFIYNLICIPVAAGALYPAFGIKLDPMLAGGAMALSSVSVVLNSLRLKRVRL